MYRHRPLIIATITILAALPPQAATLVDKSPFIPPGFQPPEERRQAPVRPTPPPSRNLEFRGVYELDGILHINIHDRGENKGEWVTLNDASAGFLVTDFSLETDSITIEIDGESSELSLASTQRAPAAPRPTASPAVQRPPRPDQLTTRQRVITPPQPSAQARRSADNEESPQVRRPVRRVVVPRR